MKPRAAKKITATCDEQAQRQTRRLRGPSCRTRVHGNGLCRRHYDEDRYLQTTARSPEAVAEAQREQAIEGELTLGCVAAWRSPHGTNSMFATDEERRAAWEERREALMADYLTPPLLPGPRPFAWWRYEASES